jgi:hypothetical protein
VTATYLAAVLQPWPVLRGLALATTLPASALAGLHREPTELQLATPVRSKNMQSRWLLFLSKGHRGSLGRT